MTRKSLEERDAEAREQHRVEEIAADLRQFRRLRQSFPGMTNEELAHRMALPVKRIDRLMKHLGEKK